jgi:antitoxin HigA-1
LNRNFYVILHGKTAQEEKGAMPATVPMPANTEIVATLPPMHPGELLREEYLKPLHLSAGALARSCGVPRTRIERIANEKLGITGDTAIQLARVLGTTPEFWMNL